jgi:hypothetical protein
VAELEERKWKHELSFKTLFMSNYCYYLLSKASFMTESNMKVKADFEIIEAWTQTQKDPLI